MNDSGTQATVLVLFTTLVTVTLMMCVMTGPDRDDLTNFYTGYLSLTPLKNGLAIAGDYISAATVLSTTGIIALAGYDGYVLAVSTALSLVLLMFLLAEPCATRAGSPWATSWPATCRSGPCVSQPAW